MTNTLEIDNDDVLLDDIDLDRLESGLAIDYDNKDEEIEFNSKESKVSSDIVDDYIREMMQYDVLPVEEQTELLKIKDINKEAFDKLVLHNFRLVLSIAKRYKNCGIEFMDLIKDGQIGLMTGIQKYDISKGYSLSTYASWWIRREIMKDIYDNGRTIRIPISVAQERKKLVDKMNEIELDKKKNGIKYNFMKLLEEAGKDLGYNIERASEIYNSTINIASLDCPLDSDDGSGDSSLSDFVADDTKLSVEDCVIDSLDREKVHFIIDEVLKGREKEIIKKRFGLDGNSIMTLNQVGEEMDLTRERVRQIEAKALKKLRVSKIARSEFSDRLGYCRRAEWSNGRA